MYDLILCVLATQKNNRLPFFNSNGYKKTSKYKTKVVYLVENEERPNYLKKDSDWYNSNYYYGIRYLDYLRSTKDKSRWFLQVDDDSCTDIDKTIEFLDFFHDWNDSVCLGTIVNKLKMTRYFDRSSKDIFINSCYFDSKFKSILKKTIDKEIDLNDFVISPKSFNGWEYCIFSNKSVEKIKNFDKLNNYIENCQEIKPKFSDQPCYVLSNLLKISISNCFFMCPLPYYEEYTGINKNGNFSHIHHVCNPIDQLNLLGKVIENNLEFENSNEVINYFGKNLEDTSWMFYEYDLIEKKILKRFAFKLLENNSIEKIEIDFKNFEHNADKYNLNYNSDSIILDEWKFCESNVYLTINKIQHEFKKKKENYYNCLFENKVYILSKLNSIDLIYWSHKKFVYNFSENLY